MKQIICLTVIVLTVLTLVSCTKNTSDTKLESKSISAETTAQYENTAKDNTVDLTGLSNTMAYSELYNMAVRADEYIGKTIKMRGKYAVYEGENRKYYVCEISDATACCTQGLEFVLKDKQGYPEYNSESPVNIEIIGTFNTYTEEEQVYFQLENASLSIID